ncbi:MAG: helix-turn-helix transcriptional regulator [Deltaproteobacteria bacterium]|nr:helix-turn-helix transcriptional regulator [Deltaproteobacteria bacterium]
MEKKPFLNTREVAELLDINEKVVYSLINEKGLPASKITGKWLFPRPLVEQWVENTTVNYPKSRNPLPPYEGLIIICGSNDILLERMISFFHNQHPGHVAVFGNLGSLGGIRSLRRNLCHIASSHLLQEDEKEYNFGFAAEELDMVPAVVNFCQREQGFVIAKGNPRGINSVEDLAKNGIRIVNRPTGSGTRLLLDGELRKAGIRGEEIDGYGIELQRHLDVGLEVLSGRADAGPCIRAVSGLLDLDFIPLRWERFDLIILKEKFFDQGIQMFLGLLRNPAFQEKAADLKGYDLSRSGEMLYPMGD